jgi:hypothetical protein
MDHGKDPFLTQKDLPCGSNCFLNKPPSVITYHNFDCKEKKNDLMTRE